MFFFIFIVCIFCVDLKPLQLDDIRTNEIHVTVSGANIETQELTLPLYASMQDALDQITLNDEMDISSLNPNQILKDHDVIQIPSISHAGQIKVSINTGTLEQLEMLPGIGPSTAQKIITYREENGLYQRLEDIQNVSGIGPSKYEKIQDYITL